MPRARPQYFHSVNLNVQFINSQKARQVCLTGIWRWNVKGSWCVRLEVCASPESPPAKSSEQPSMVLPPQPTLPFWLLNCFLCFLPRPLAFVNAWHRRLFRTLRKLPLPIASYFLNLCSSKLFLSFPFIQWVSLSKEATYPLFSHVKLLHYPRCSEIQTQAICTWTLPPRILQCTGLCDSAVLVTDIQPGEAWAQLLNHSTRSTYRSEFRLCTEKAWMLIAFTTASCPCVTCFQQLRAGKRWARGRDQINCTKGSVSNMLNIEFPALCCLKLRYKVEVQSPNKM